MAVPSSFIFARFLYVFGMSSAVLANTGFMASTHASNPPALSIRFSACKLIPPAY